MRSVLSDSKLAHFKLVISDASGKSVSQELRDKAAQPLLGSRIGDTLDSSVIGLTQGKRRITVRRRQVRYAAASRRSWRSKEICITFKGCRDAECR